MEGERDEGDGDGEKGSLGGKWMERCIYGESYMMFMCFRYCLHCPVGKSTPQG